MVSAVVANLGLVGCRMATLFFSLWCNVVLRLRSGLLTQSASSGPEPLSDSLLRALSSTVTVLIFSFGFPQGL